MDERVIIAGFGGQGVMLMGKILAQAGMLAGLNVTWIPKYGAEVRGGTAHCMVRISHKPIASPLVEFPTAIIVLNKPSLVKFENKVRPQGTVIVNSSLIDEKVTRDDVKVYYVPCTLLANQLGDVKGSNMVALGALVASWGFLNIDVVKEALKHMLPAYRHKYIPLNQKALDEGAHAITNA
ncbi:MAG: 2-oxoacid:acceptor oxidoreductase family protein [Candidatus Omnitrophica bacterium]|nr:2-oxoacid:acceptor oxidoreductase family protein [Candidatus Omnitrophota bacterium]